MAKLTPKRLEEIVRKEAPGYRVARPPSDAADARQQLSADAAEETTPDVEQAKRKPAPSRSVQEPADAVHPARAKAADASDDDDQIVALEPEMPVDPWDRGSRPKSIVVDGTGKVIGRQG